MHYIKFISLIILLFLSYGYIPTFILRKLWRPDIQFSEKYLLTFDDGPSEITKELINILDEKDQKAVFFLLGEKLDKYDTSIYKNHILGSHGYRHVNFAILSPIKTYVEFEKAMIAFKEKSITPKYFRAPYGLYNIMLIYLIKKNKMKIFHWNYLLGDWKVEEKLIIYNRIKKRANNKNILVLHDGTEGKAKSQAKYNMLKELKIFLDEETKRQQNFN